MSNALRRSQPATAAGTEEEGGQDRSWLERTLGRLIEHVRTLLPVDGAAFLVVDPERRSIEPVADWFASSELRLATEPANRRRYDPAHPGLPELALEGGRPLLIPRLEAWEAAPRLRAAARHAFGEVPAAQLWEAYRCASVIACPVKTASGGALGVLIVASLDPARPLGRPELKTVGVLSDLSALAFERTEMLDAEARRVREEQRLGRAAEAMSASLEPDEVYRRIVEHAACVTGATKSILTQLDAPASELTVAAAAGFSEGFARRRFSLENGVLGMVARTRRPYLSRASDASRWDRSVVQSEGIGSFIHAPIELGPRLFGVLTVAHEERDRFTVADLELLVKLARSSAAAIANATDFERERRIARALTLGFVPESLPELPDYEVGLLYEPAAKEPTGGDLYGAWRLPDGALAVLIGDVTGKGVETAALSAMVRFFIEARSWDSPSPSVVLTQANTMLRSRLPRDTFVTAFLGLIASGRLRYCNAGHLPPLLVSSGRAAPLPSHGLPLGIEQSPGYEEGALALRPEDVVFAYTDGLIEPRRRGEVYGVDRLSRFVADRADAESLERLVRGAHDEAASWAGGLADDAVALALRRRAA